MADYPDITQVVGTRFTPNDGTVVERAVNGRPRIRSYFTQVWNEGVVVHECDGPDKDLIVAHHAAHRGLPFNFRYHGDGLTYTVRYAGAPQPEPAPGTDRWKVTTQLVVF